MNNKKQSTMLRPILRLIAANITPHYYVVDYKKYMHSHRPTNSLSYYLIEPVQINHVPPQPKIIVSKNNSNIVTVQELIAPKCQDCVNFRPRQNVDKTSAEYNSLARCALFVNKCVGGDGAKFEYADNCRNDEKMCGPQGLLRIQRIAL